MEDVRITVEVMSVGSLVRSAGFPQFHGEVLQLHVFSQLVVLR